MLALVGPASPRLLLGAAVLILPQRHPLRLVIAPRLTSDGYASQVEGLARALEVSADPA
jgi:hypothetical protein